MRQKIKKEVALVYLVAGISSRFGGKPKAFAKITENKRLIEYSLDQALKSNFSKIIFVVGEKTKKQFKKKFGSSYKGIPVFYALQKYNKKTRNKPWGTCDALCAATPFLNCPFVVCNGDDIYGEHSFKILYNHLQKSKEEATVSYRLINVLPEKGTVNRGILKSEKGYVKEIKDSKNVLKADLKATDNHPNDPCSTGIFALHPESLKFLHAELKKFKRQHRGNKDAEYGLPDQITKLIKTKKAKMKIYPAIGKWIGITNPGDEKTAREILED